MKRVLSDIKNNTYKPCYLFFGDEDYLKNQYRDKIIKALFPEGDTMNLNRFGEDANETDIVEAALAMPFFADRRLVVAEDTGLFKKEAKALSEFLKDVPETTTLLFVEKNVDKRNACYKAIDKSGIAIEFSLPTPAELEAWIMGRLKRENKSITRAAMTEFIERCGSDMETMDKELEKLICYALDKEGIDERDVDAVCIPQITSNVWKMIDALADKNAKGAYMWYQKLLSAKEDPLHILNLIQRHFRLMLSSAELDAKGHNVNQIAAELSLRDFAVRNYLRQSKSFNKKKVISMLSKMAELESNAKMGKIRDFSAVEVIIAEFSV